MEATERSCESSEEENPEPVGTTEAAQDTARDVQVMVAEVEESPAVECTEEETCAEGVAEAVAEPIADVDSQRAPGDQDIMKESLSNEREDTPELTKAAGELE